MALIAVAFSDWHLHRWKSFSKEDKRMFLALSVLDRVSEAAALRKVPILFLGDMIHNEKAIDNKLLYYTLKRLKALNPKLYGISGNHDMSEKNYFEKRSPTYLETFSMICNNVVNMDFNQTFISPGVKIHGIPYVNGNRGINKVLKGFIENIKPQNFNILMMHGDLPGATDTFGYAISEVENLKMKYLRKFNLVLSGHIHKPQKIANNIFMLGAPYQQTRSEQGLELGYWEIYTNKDPKFVPLKFPKFIDITEGEEIPNDGNYYTVIPKIREEKVSKKKFHNKTDKVKLAKRYLKTIGIKDKDKKLALIKLLNSTE